MHFQRRGICFVTLTVSAISICFSVCVLFSTSDNWILHSQLNTKITFWSLTITAIFIHLLFVCSILFNTLDILTLCSQLVSLRIGDLSYHSIFTHWFIFIQSRVYRLLRPQFCTFNNFSIRTIFSIKIKWT